jgi:hypothetical protein
MRSQPESSASGFGSSLSAVVGLKDIDEMLPGVKSSLMSRDGEPIDVFKFEDGELNAYEQARRLGSPSHWRGYLLLRCRLTQ